MAFKQKKALPVLVVCFFVLAAGCAKRNEDEPAPAELSTVQTVSGEQGEIIIDLEPDESAAAGSTGNGTTKAGETRTATATGAAASTGETLPFAADEETMAGAGSTSAASNCTTTEPSGAAAGPRQTTSVSAGVNTTAAGSTSLPSVHNEPRVTTTTAAGRTGGYELPAIPLK